MPALPCSVAPVEGLMSLETVPGQGARCKYELGTRAAPISDDSRTAG